MTTPANELIENIDTYLENPARLQQSILNFTEEATAGRYTYVDPTNPVVNAIESAVLTSSAAINRCGAILRKLYPVQAQTFDDLFLHMSDRDYLDRFAVPSRAKIVLMFRKTELLDKLVADPVMGYRKLVIPRNSYFTVAGMRFSLEYPIEIRQLSHGDIQIIYDTEKISPIETLTSNLINFDEAVNPEGDRFIRFTFDVTQVSATSRVFDINSITRFNETIALTDQYYFTRVFVRGDQSDWIEIPTTHSQQVYDPTQMTATLRVEEKVLTVGIPEIYTVSTNSNSKIRVDYYETLGPVRILLSNYENSEFSATWFALDPTEIDQYSAPLSTFQTIVIYSSSIVAGGKDGLSFEELRERMLNNGIGNPQLPISSTQIKYGLEDQNYEIVTNIDNLTDRVLAASRELPAPTNEKLITAASGSIQTGLFTMEDAVLVDTVIDNGTSITITSDTIYQNQNGRVTLLPSAIVNNILTLPIDQRALFINNNRFYYSPFHYVLDGSTNDFDVRPYYLDSPEVINKNFVSANSSTLMQATVNNYRILKGSAGYRLEIELRTSDNLRQLDPSEVYVQLMFRPYGENEYAYQNGTVIGTSSSGELIFGFDLSTTFNVTKNNALELTKFFMFTPDAKILGSNLSHDFDIIVGTDHPMDTQFVPNEVDAALGRFLLPPGVSGISRERLTLRFGHYLSNLWARARTVPTEAAYARYATDVPDVYLENEYEINPDTNTIVFIDPDTGVPETRLLHAAGEQKTFNGELVYLHRAGDVILDDNDEPVIDGPRRLFRQIDYMLIEGSYYFATDSIAIAYRKEMTDIYVSWIINDLADIQKKLIEQTRIYFYPKTMTGDIDVMVRNGINTSIAAGQRFLLTLHVNENVYNNIPLRNQLRVSAIEVIGEELKKSTISMSRITRELVNTFADDVVDAEISGLGGTNNYSALTVLHETDRPSIRKLLKAQSDGTLIVDEAVELTFIRHVIQS